MGNSGLNQDLSYGDILAGRPGAWLLKTNIFYMHAIKKVLKKHMLKFKTISRTCKIFMIAFTVYEQRAYIDVRYGGTYPRKTG